MKRLAKSILLGCFIFCSFLSPQARAETTITVYGNSEPEMLRLYTAEFKKTHPDITIKWVRDSAGPILSRLMAERDAPRADVIFGLSLAAALTLQPHGLLEPYRPQGLDELLPEMRAKDDPPSWVPVNAWGAAICLNTKELEKLKLDPPASWADLKDPKYKGLVVMPSPVSSSTGLFIVETWLSLLGDEKAWEYMEELDSNIKMYIHSGCKPCQMAAQGEAPIGVSSGVCAVPWQKRKAPLAVVTPSEGTGWDMEVAALVKKDRADDDPVKIAAKKFLDFAASPAVAKIAADNGYIPARAEALTEEAAKQRSLFLTMDFEAGAKRRDEVLKEWRLKFDHGESK